MRTRTLAIACLMSVVCVGAAVAQATSDPAAAFGNLWAYGGALATSALLGVVKKADTSITNSTLFRKLQPVLTLAGAFGAAALAAHGGPTVDPSMLASAPLATVVTVTAAELLSLLGRKK